MSVYTKEIFESDCLLIDRMFLISLAIDHEKGFVKNANYWVDTFKDLFSTIYNEIKTNIQTGGAQYIIENIINLTLFRANPILGICLPIIEEVLGVNISKMIVDGFKWLIGLQSEPSEQQIRDYTQSVTAPLVGQTATADWASGFKLLEKNGGLSAFIKLAQSNISDTDVDRLRSNLENSAINNPRQRTRSTSSSGLSRRRSRSRGFWGGAALLGGGIAATNLTSSGSGSSGGNSIVSMLTSGGKGLVGMLLKWLLTLTLTAVGYQAIKYITRGATNATNSVLGTNIPNESNRAPEEEVASGNAASQTSSQSVFSRPSSGNPILSMPMIQVPFPPRSGDEYHINSGERSWAVPLTNQNPRDTLLVWINDIYPQLGKYRNEIISGNNFNIAVNYLNNHISNENPNWLYVPEGIHTRKEVVDRIIEPALKAYQEETK